MADFVEFPKIARYSREVIVTEKIDGTNACVFIRADGEYLVGSRTRWITPENDNYGFAQWAQRHKQELLKLGPGLHYGEWWGSGIQRGYGLEKGDKRFSLFNTIRWCSHGEEPQLIKTADPRIVKMQEVLPPCVDLVPILWRGNFDDLDLNAVLYDLRQNGSKASPGFLRPEGVVIYNVAANTSFKKTLERDEEPKCKK